PELAIRPPAKRSRSWASSSSITCPERIARERRRAEMRVSTLRLTHRLEFEDASFRDFDIRGISRLRYVLAIWLSFCCHTAEFPSAFTASVHPVTPGTKSSVSADWRSHVPLLPLPDDHRPCTRASHFAQRQCLRRNRRHYQRDSRCNPDDGVHLRSEFLY